jgi:hypothetical protein
MYKVFQNKFVYLTFVLKPNVTVERALLPCMQGTNCATKANNALGWNRTINLSMTYCFKLPPPPYYTCDVSLYCFIRKYTFKKSIAKYAELGVGV